MAFRFLPRFSIGVALVMLMSGSSLPAHLSCCELDLEEGEGAVPLEHIGQSEVAAGGMTPLSVGDLTLIPVDIDPLAAPPDTPWLVFAATLNVRTEPSTRGGSATVVGSLPRNSEVAGDYYIVAESDEEWLEIRFQGQPRYISRTGVTRPHPANVQRIAEHGDLPAGFEIVNRWWAVPIAYEPSDLVEIPLTYTTNVSGRIYLLRRAARDAVVAMLEAARADGLDFRVGSPYRSGASQTTIYQNNVSRNLAQRSSAPPGHSEHQLGTTMDFSIQSGSRFLRNTDPEYQWLVQNAARFGFVQTYTADNIGETGYIEEPWHWRYFGRHEIDLVAQPAEAGQVTGAGTYFGGQEVILEARPEPGYLFDRWSLEGAVKINPLVFRVNGAQTLTAHFVPDPIAVARAEGIQQVLDNPAAFGFFTAADLEAARDEARDQILGDPATYGLYSAESIVDLDLGGLILRKAEGGVVLEFQIKTSADLQQWSVIERLERFYEIGPDKQFFRVRALPGPSQAVR
jgi:LAS superfamily LD-carboxypeptidase LdcB